MLNHNFYILKIIHTTGVATELGRGRSSSSEGKWHVKVEHSVWGLPGKTCWDGVVAGHLFWGGSERTPSAYPHVWSSMETAEFDTSVDVFSWRSLLSSLWQSGNAQGRTIYSSGLCWKHCHQTLTSSFRWFGLPACWGKLVALYCVTETIPETYCGCPSIPYWFQWWWGTRKFSSEHSCELYATPLSILGRR